MMEASRLLEQQPNRLKFRGWSERLSKMFYFFLFDDEQAKAVDYCTRESGEGCLKIMQSTGLCDKNGKEIFEGDILKENGRSEFDVEYGDTFVVEWIPEWGYDGPGFWASGERLRNLREPEVTGNIYENPELLEKKG